MSDEDTSTTARPRTASYTMALEEARTPPRPSSLSMSRRGGRRAAAASAAHASTSASASSRPKNPFAASGEERDKENFPDLDTFLFGTQAAAKTTTTREDDHQSSFFSQEGSSILNMSIGARAALNEHMRHIEKFGIDGEVQQQQDDGDAAGTSPRRQQQQNQQDALDEQWDRLLNNSNHVVDTSGSFAAVSSYPRLDILANSGIEESIEIMTDTSTDYFNSSRVYKTLHTPERNRNRPDMVMSRQDMQEQCLFEEESDFAESSAPEFKMVSSSSHHDDHHHQQPSPSSAIVDGVSSSHPHHQETSFHSFCAADLSRISNSSDSQPPGLILDDGDGDTSNGVQVGPSLSPVTKNDSIQRGNKLTKRSGMLKIDDEGEFSPIMKGFTTLSPQPHIHADSSFNSYNKPQFPSSSSPPRLEIGGLNLKMPTALSSSCKRRLLRPRPRPRVVDDDDDDFDVMMSGDIGIVRGLPPFDSYLSSPFPETQTEVDHCRISRYRHHERHASYPFFPEDIPPIARARAFGGTEQESLPPQQTIRRDDDEDGNDMMPAIDNMPNEFLQVLENDDNDRIIEGSISPISRGNGSTILNRSTNTGNSSKGRDYDDKNNNSSSDSNNISSLSTSSAVLTGRKRYRTVVPLRVFLDNPSEFPPEYDSFSRPSTNGNKSSSLETSTSNNNNYKNIDSSSSSLSAATNNKKSLSVSFDGVAGLSPIADGL